MVEAVYIIYGGSLKGHYGQSIGAKNKLAYFWPQWLLIVPDSFLSGRAYMRGPLSDRCAFINRSFSVFSVGPVRALLFFVPFVLFVVKKSVTFRANPW